MAIKTTGLQTYIDGAKLIINYTDAIGIHAIDGHEQFALVGYNGDVDTAIEDVWEVGGDYVFPTSGIQMQVVSTSANDDGSPAGTGVRTVHVHYLDSSLNERFEEVVLNGTTPVSTTATDIYRVNYFHSGSVGGGGSAAGVITLKNLAGTNTYKHISAGFNDDFTAVFTVPSGKNLYMTGWSMGAGGTSAGKFVRAYLNATSDIKDAATPGVFHTLRIISAMDSSIESTVGVPILIPSGVDIRVSAYGELNSVVTVFLSGWLE